MAAIRWYHARTQIKQPPVPARQTAVQQAQLEKAVAFVRKISLCDEFDRYPVEVMNWLGEGIYGKSEDERIIISKDCFDKGTKFLASTILEEFAHGNYGLADESRSL